MKAHTDKVTFFGVLVLLTLKSFTAHAARQQQVITQSFATVPVSTPLLQKGNVAIQHGSWGQIRRLVSTPTASTSPPSMSAPRATPHSTSLSSAKIALSAEKLKSLGPDSDCGTRVQPLCPKEEEPPGDGLIKKTLPPEAPDMKIHVKKVNFDQLESYTFMVDPAETIHNIKLKVMIEDGLRNGKIENRAQLLGRKQRQRREAKVTDYVIYFGQVVCEDGYTLEHYGVQNEDTLNLVVFEEEEKPDGSGLKAGESPETEPPCVTRPPCQRGFFCHDENPKNSMRPRSRASHLGVSSVGLLISAILIFFTCMW